MVSAKLAKLDMDAVTCFDAQKCLACACVSHLIYLGISWF